MAKNSKVVYGASDKTNVSAFEPEKLHPVIDKTHPSYGEHIHPPISEAVILNIMDQGVLEPIITWKGPETGLSCVIDGRQHVRHIPEVNKRLTKEGKGPLLVPAVTKRGSATRMTQAMVNANKIRQADTPLDRAKKMADAPERGHDENDLALIFGVSIRTVRATLSLLDTTQAVRDTVESGTATVAQTCRPGTLPPGEQRTKVAEIELATVGTKGHEEAHRQRQILGEAKSYIKSRKEIAKALENAGGEYTEALHWMLGEA